MRKNFFGETIAQPTDDIADVKNHLDDIGFVPMCADVFAEKDETYGFNGELRDENGDSFSFDGFDSLEDAKAFARNFVPAGEIELVD